MKEGTLPEAVKWGDNQARIETGQQSIKKRDMGGWEGVLQTQIVHGVGPINKDN